MIKFQEVYSTGEPQFDVLEDRGKVTRLLINLGQFTGSFFANGADYAELAMELCKKKRGRSTISLKRSRTTCVMSFYRLCRIVMPDFGTCGFPFFVGAASDTNKLASGTTQIQDAIMKFFSQSLALLLGLALLAALAFGGYRAVNYIVEIFTSLDFQAARITAIASVVTLLASVIIAQHSGVRQAEPGDAARRGKGQHLPAID